MKTTVNQNARTSWSAPAATALERGRALPGRRSVQQNASALDDADRTLRQPGEPLEPEVQARFGYRFRRDFSGVRVHADAEGARSASALGAHAYTYGDHIVFGQGRFAPSTDVGERLLAHELTHVVQQRAAGAPPPVGTARLSRADEPAESEADDASRIACDPTILVTTPLTYAASGVVQRDEDPAAREARARALDDLDQFRAVLVRVFSSGMESSSPDILIAQAGAWSRQYGDVRDDDTKVRTRLALGTALTRAYEGLRAAEESAEHDVDGALLTRQVGDMVPWEGSRPRTVTDLPIFSEESRLAWQADAALDERLRVAEQPRRRHRGPARLEPPPLVSTAVDATEGTAPLGDTSVTVQEQTAQEGAAGGTLGGGSEIQRGIALLRSKPLGNMGVATREPAQGQPQSAAPAARAQRSVIGACAQIWFISNRLYQVDRTGHLLPGEEVWFDVSALSGFQGGHVYFFVPVDRRIGGQQVQFEAYDVEHPDTPGAAGIMFPRVLTALIPVLEIRQQVQDQGAGIGLIIARDFGRRQTMDDLSFGNLERAARRVRRHLKWALDAEVARIREDPLGEVAQQALGVAMSYAARLLPPVGAAMMMYQLLRLAEWLGDVANVAAYAHSDDEIDIAAQAIARKLVTFVVSEVISRVGHAAGRVGVRGARAVGGRSATPAPDVHAPTVPATPEGGPSRPSSAAPSEPHAPDRAAPPATTVPPSRTETPSRPAAAPGEPARPAPHAPEPRPDRPTVEPPSEAPPTRPAPARPEPTETPPTRTAPPRPHEQRPTTHPAAEEPHPTTAPPAPHQQPSAPRQQAPHADRPQTPHTSQEPQPSGSGQPSPSPAAPPHAPAPTPPTAAPTTPGVHALDDVFAPGDRSRFATGDPDVRARLTPDQAAALDRLQAAYDRYCTKRGNTDVPPEEWARRQTSGQPRQDAESLFGRDYARTGRGSSQRRVRLTDIPRPAQYDDARFQADLARLNANQGSLWARLRALRARGLAADGIEPGLLAILKGNIGEIMAHPELEAQLNVVRARTPDARLELGTRVARLRPDGTYAPPVLFSDGLVASEAGGRLRIHDAFEVKSGSRGGAEATSQFFEWREGRLSDGDRIVLADGRRFTYHPGRSGPGYVDDLYRSTPRIVTARGAGHYGLQSSEQVGITPTRRELGTTASELDFLARAVLETLPAAPATPEAAH